MKKYGSQLKGWAIDRAIELVKANKSDSQEASGLCTPAEVIAKAQEFIDFAYSPDEDFRDAVTRIVEVLKQSDVEDALVKVRELLAELAYIEEDLVSKQHLKSAISPSSEVANDSKSQES